MKLKGNQYEISDFTALWGKVLAAAPVERDYLFLGLDMRKSEVDMLTGGC